MSELPPLEAGVIIAAKYRLESPLARGGMGSVWRAVHAGPGATSPGACDVTSMPSSATGTVTLDAVTTVCCL